MRRILGVFGLIIGILLMSGVAQAVQWNGSGPLNAHDSYEFFGCWNFLHLEHAYQDYSGLGATSWGKYLAVLNGNDATDQFHHAWDTTGDTGTVEANLFAWSYYITSQINANQPPDPSGISYMDSQCGPIRSISGTWNSYNFQKPVNCNPTCSLQNTQTLSDGVRWNACQVLILDGDSAITSAIDLGEMAWELHTMTGLDIRYIAGTGSSANIWVHEVSFIPGNPEPVGLTTPAFSLPGPPFVESHADVQILSSTTGGTLLADVRHELGHSVGLGHASTSDEIMYPFVGPSLVMYQAGDFFGGMLLGLYQATC